jgi:hypothetical protein
MQASNIPTKFQKAWGASAGSGYIRTIPVASQIGVTNGAASFTDGFPPATFSPVAAGGVPPFGQDFNGIFNEITSWDQWFQMGGPIKYDATFQSEIGGYPMGALVASATTLGTFWLATIDANTSNPDTGGAGWYRIIGSTGVTAGTYVLPAITVDTYGRVTNIGSETNVVIPGTLTVEGLATVFSPLQLFSGPGSSVGGELYGEQYGSASGNVIASSVGLVGGPTSFTATTGWVLNTSGAAGYSTFGGQFGLMTGYNSQAIAFYATSDVRLKDNLKTISPDEGLRFVTDVHPTSFVWKKDGARGTGYIAQQLIAAGYEHLVSTIANKDVAAAEHQFGDMTVQSPDGMQMIAKYDDTNALLHAALRGALAQIAALETRLTALES